MSNLDLLSKLCHRRLNELNLVYGPALLERLHDLMDTALENGVVVDDSDEASSRLLVQLQWASELVLASLANSHEFVHVATTLAPPTPMCVAEDALEPTVASRASSIRSLLKAKSDLWLLNAKRRLRRPLNLFYACHNAGERHPTEVYRFEKLVADCENVTSIQLDTSIRDARFDVSGAFWIARVGDEALAAAISANQWSSNRDPGDSARVQFWIGPASDGSSPVRERIDEVCDFLEQSKDEEGMEPLLADVWNLIEG